MDCNQPDNDPDFPVYSGKGHVINGEQSIESNGWNLEYYIQQKANNLIAPMGFILRILISLRTAWAG